MEPNFLTSFEISSGDEVEEKTREFFVNFKQFFTTSGHSGIFLLGVLTQFLLNIQKEDRQATPFRSRLKGLKMDSRDIATLLPEIMDKLEQYKKNYYVALERVISQYLLEAGDYKNWKMSVDEMNYVFALGMNMSKYFKVKNL